MMRRSILAASVAITVLAVIVFVAVAQEKEAPKEPMAGMEHHSMAHPEAAKPAAESPAPAAMTPEEMMKACREHMAKMGMSEGMMMRCKMMCAAALAKDDPAAVLALKDDLKLTSDQAARLESISSKAREDAKAVLTAEQKKKLDELDGTPATMMGFCSEMRSKMGDMKMNQGMTCPMMGGMGQAKEGQAMEGMSCPMMGGQMQPAPAKESEKPAEVKESKPMGGGEKK